MKNSLTLTGVVLGLLSCFTFSVAWNNPANSGLAEFGPNDIMVSVFQDFNGDGIRQTATEPLIPGLTLRAYNTANVQVAEDIVGTNGNYLLNVGAGSGAHRVEVTGLSADLQPGAVGTSTVFFASANQTVLVAVENPDQYSQDNPPLITTCFIEGPQPTGSGETLIRFDYDSGCFDAGINATCDDGGMFTGPKASLAFAPDIGSTFGVAYQRATRSAFASAFMKRHAGFKSNGKSGIIYRIQNPNTATPTITEYIDFDALGIPTKPLTGDPHPADNAPVADWERDNNSWDWVGKMSFGDLDISEDGETLFVVNLFDKKLYYFPAKPTPYTLADAALVQSVTLPQPCGSDVDARPFGLGIYNGKVYFSMVCTGESTIGTWAGGKIPANTACSLTTLPAGDRAALSARIYEFDPGTSMVNTTPVLTFPLNYGRGRAINSSYGPTSATWNPWVKNWTVFNRPPRPNPANVNEQQFFQDRSYPQPMLTDIEFDGGNMVLGFRDRFGDQTGHLQRPPTGFTINVDNTVPINSFNGLFDGVAEGDILRACGSPTSGWTLESGGACGGVAGPTGPNSNSNGPGGGEYYSQDDYDNFHNEITQGGMVIVPGHEDVVTIVTDPINSSTEFYDAGVVWYRNRDGQRVQNFLVFSTAVGVGGDDGPTFAKANGLGDMIALSDPTPIQIGNRVWFDANEDGIQSPNEPGINGVTVELFKDIGGTLTKVAETVTAASALQGGGAFKFTNSTEQTWSNGQTEVLPNMDYEIRVSLTSVQAQMANVTSFTLQNGAGDATNDNKTDLSDSDVNPAGVVAFRTGDAGENNHTLDIGVRAECSVTGSIVSETCNGMLTPNTGDDTYAIVVTATVTNGSGAYDVLVDGVEAAANVTSGSQTTVTVPASGGTVEITFRDATDDACISAAVTSGTLATCSPLPCIITGSIVSETCDGMGTTNTADDTYAIVVTATVLNASGAYDVLVDGVEAAASITSGTSTTITIPADGGTVDISFRDALDDACATTPVSSGTLATCSPPTCDLSVENLVVTCADGTNFSITFDLSWDFVNAASDQIEVMVAGAVQPNIVPGDATGTVSVGPVVVSGPAYGLLIEAGFLTRSDCSATASFDLIACGVQCTDGLGGNVFNDSNNDGADAGAGEVGQENVLVEVYDCDGVLVCSTYTNSDGNWSCTGLNNMEEYRVEFSTPLQPYLQPSFAGTNNGTNTQFVTAPSCEVDYGVIDPTQYCNDNPLVAVVCFPRNNDAGGEPVVVFLATDDARDWPGPAIAGDTDGRWGIPSGGSTVTYPDVAATFATKAQVETTFGLDWDRKNSQLYSGAYMRAYASMGTNASANGFAEGAIYNIPIDLTSSSSMTPAVWLDLETLFGDDFAGTYIADTPFPGSQVFGQNSNNPNLIGYTGLGSIKLAADNSEMYVVNLASREVLVIPIGADGTAPTSAAAIRRFPVPNTPCDGIWPDGRPLSSVLGLGVHPVSGRVYATMTCTGPTLPDVTGYVYSFDPADATPSSTDFTLELTIPLDINRPAASPNTNQFWGQIDHPWETLAANAVSYNNDPRVGGNAFNPIPQELVSHHIQPWLGEVGFAAQPDGSFAMVVGERNRYHDIINSSFYVAGGVLYRACGEDGNWTLESGGSCGTANSSVAYTMTGTRAGQYVSPQNQFFYYVGREGAMGAGTVDVPLGGSEVVIPAMDNIFNSSTSGLSWLSTVDGGRLRDARILGDFTGPEFDNTNFTKANNWGAITALCAPVPIQIGNYVWIDTDEDGVQDACEAPLPGVPVSLYNKDTGMWEDVQTTGSDGEYYFNNVEPNSNYAIVFGYDHTISDGPWDATTGELTVNGIPYALTTADADGTNPLGPDANDLNDSDASLMDMAGLTQYPIISYMTSDSTDHTLDVGLIKLAAFDLALRKTINTTASPGPYQPGDAVTFTVKVFNQGDIDATDVEVTDYAPTGLTFTSVAAGTLTTDNGATATVTDNGAGVFTIDALAAGDSLAVDITLTIDVTFMGVELVNYAEITSFDDDGDAGTAPPVDEDSTPGNNQGLDETGTDNNIDDDGPGGNGTPDDPTDNDDYDPAILPVLQTFDLALTKVLDVSTTPGPFTIGSPVAYVITVFNQGTLDATDIEVSDYAPDGLTLVPGGGWTDAGGGIVTLDAPFDLAAGGMQTLNISFTIDADFTGTELINSAEITAATNALGLPDEDSTPGDNVNDAPETGTDNNIDDNGLNGNGTADRPDDADDFDPVQIMVEYLSIGSTVFIDANNNGVQDMGEVGIEGVEVEVYAVGATPGTDAPVGSDQTDANGDYFVGGLAPGNYFVVINTAPAAAPISSNGTTSGFTETDPDDNQDNDDEGLQPGGAGTAVTSGTVTLALRDEPVDGTIDGTEFAQGNLQDNGEIDANGNMTLDFGFFAPVTVGDTAFVDVDMDGTQSVGDLPLPGATVFLLDSNGDPVVTDAEGNTITGETMTDADGSYSFGNLPPGSYSVVFDISTADNAEFFTFTTANTGDDANDSDNSISLTETTAQSDPTPFLNSGEADLTLDVGVACALEVTVANPFTICSTGTIDLTVGSSVTPLFVIGASWETSGNGRFLGALGNELVHNDPFPVSYSQAVTYIPGSQDIRRGYVILTLTTNDPPVETGCAPVSASVRVEILKVDCGEFMWDGQ